MLFKLGAEDDHHAVLEEIVELNRVRVEPLTLEVMDPAGCQSKVCSGRRHRPLFFRLLDLEADDISILNLTLCKGELRLHKLDHARFDFLVRPIRFANTSQ